MGLFSATAARWLCSDNAVTLEGVCLCQVPTAAVLRGKSPPSGCDAVRLTEQQCWGLQDL